MAPTVTASGIDHAARRGARAKRRSHGASMIGGPTPVEPNHADRSPEDAEAARITDLYRDDDPDYDEDSYDDEYNNAFGVDETLANARRASGPPPMTLARRVMRFFPLTLVALRARLLSRRSRFFREDRDA